MVSTQEWCVEEEGALVVAEKARGAISYHIVPFDRADRSKRLGRDRTDANTVSNLVADHGDIFGNGEASFRRQFQIAVNLPKQDLPLAGIQAGDFAREIANSSERQTTVFGLKCFLDGRYIFGRPAA